MQIDWSLVAAAVGSLATAVAALFSWQSARVAAKAAKSAEAMAKLEVDRREDELRAVASGIFAVATRSDPDRETRRVTVHLQNASSMAVSDVLLDLTGTDGVGRSKTWRTELPVLPAGADYRCDLDLPWTTATDGWGESVFGRGTDVDPMIWSLWFDDPAGRHWRATDRGLVTVLPQRPKPRSISEIVAEHGLEPEYADEAFDGLWLDPPDRYPEFPPTTIGPERISYRLVMAPRRLWGRLRSASQELRDRW